MTRTSIQNLWWYTAPLLVVVICCTATATASAYAYDCEEGCDLDPSINGPLVCGVDGLTYPNECFAICQDVAIERTGNCHDNENHHDNTNNVVKVSLARTTPTNNNRDDDNHNKERQSGFISKLILNRFAQEGFKFTRQRTRASLGKGRIQRSELEIPVDNNDARIRSNTNNNNNNNNYQAIRVTSEGYEYIQTVENAKDGNIPQRQQQQQQSGSKVQSVNGYDPQHHRHLRSSTSTTTRNTKVIGIDDRSPVIDTTVAPYSYIGQLDYTNCDGCCTGTLIHDNAVLTAGHCVYDAKEEEWDIPITFAPGQNGYESQSFWNVFFQQTPSKYQPYGTWQIDYATTYRKWAMENDYGYDIGILVLKRNDYGQHAGEVVGYAGLAQVESYDDVKLQTSTLTGYPEDKLNQMWTSGPCGPNGFWETQPGFPYDHLTLHDCDSEAGNSGSAFLGSDQKIRGVHTVYHPGLKANGGPLFKKGSPHYQSVLTWSGLTLSEEDNDNGMLNEEEEEEKDPTYIEITSPTPEIQPVPVACECPCERTEFMCRIVNNCIMGYNSKYQEGCVTHSNRGD